MGLRCSVLGHRYGARERIEERDDDGDEVVVIAREIKTCDRCGAELVVSESKEVTAAPGAIPTDPRDSDAEADEGPPVEAPDGSVGHPPEEEVEDDGVIMEATVDRPKRAPGEWPAAPEDPDEEDGDAEPWPDIEVEADEGFDAVSADEDGAAVDELIQAASAAAADAADDSSGEETEAGFVKADDIHSPTDPAEGNVRTEYYCPQCEWSRESVDASVRAGDICPECRIGYIAERDPR